MSVLSVKARAFSVDQLLGKKQRDKSDARVDIAAVDKAVYVNEECVCPFMGDDPNCRHENMVEILDDNGEAVKIELCQADLWQAFHRLGTEMIITKTGRRMFPAVRIRISGLKKTSNYKIWMDFLPVDKNKYRYVYHSSRWMVSGVGDTMKPCQNYNHPESPTTGDYMTSQVISFEKIKLTNHEKPGKGQISLLSMQKFQPRIRILEKGGISKAENCLSATFPQTSFIAVTAYQNQEITRLKIARNPFAKGFREAGKCRSSLEAMMASFGVVIDSNQCPMSLPGKRRLEDSQILDPREPSPPKHAMWSPTPQLIDHPLCMYPPMFFNPTVHAHPNAASTDTNIKQTDSLHIKEVKMEDNSDTCETHLHSSIFSSSSSVSSSFLSSPVSLSSTPLPSISPLPMHLQSTDIHPAFPCTHITHFPYVDTHALAAYYKELLQCSPCHDIMLVPASLVPAASGTQYGVYSSALSSQAVDSVSHNPEKLLPL